MSAPCSTYDAGTMAGFKTVAISGGGVHGYTASSGTPYVSMVQGVNGSDSVQYIVLTQYKQQLASELPCDRSYAGACAEFNAVALTGHMVSAVMVTHSLTP